MDGFLGGGCTRYQLETRFARINVGGWCFCTYLTFIWRWWFFCTCLQFTLFSTSSITHRNPWFLRWRAWRNNETNVGGWWCCPNIFGPWCSPAKQGLFHDAHRLTRQFWWWVVVVVKRRTQQPTHPHLSGSSTVHNMHACLPGVSYQYILL